jgi:protein-tyrosine phosphatase
LFVCAGNICRSPFAASVLNHALTAAPAPRPRIESAGTHALVDFSMDEDAARLCSDLGADPSGHRARRVTESMLADASIVLTATRELRSAVVELHPRAVQYSWTIRQAGVILEQLHFGDEPTLVSPGSDRVGEIKAFITSHRGLDYRRDRSDDDVVDPYRQSPAVHELAARQMLPALSQLSLALGGPLIEWASPGERPGASVAAAGSD